MPLICCPRYPLGPEAPVFLVESAKINARACPKRPAGLTRVLARKLPGLPQRRLCSTTMRAPEGVRIFRQIVSRSGGFRGK